jgi:hypothetical protein
VRIERPESSQDLLLGRLACSPLLRELPTQIAERASIRGCLPALPRLLLGDVSLELLEGQLYIGHQLVEVALRGEVDLDQCLRSPRAGARSEPTESFESVAQQPTQSSGMFPKTALCLSSTVPSEL